MASLGTPASQACPKCGTGWKKIGFSFIALFVLAGIGSFLLWIQNTSNATLASDLEDQVEELQLDLGLKQIEVNDAPGPTPFFYSTVGDGMGYFGSVVMVDATTGEESEIIEGNVETYAVPRIGYDGRIFTVMGPVDADLPKRAVSVFNIETQVSGLVGMSVSAVSSTNPLSPDETKIITGVEFLGDESKADYQEDQILLFDLMSSEIKVLGTYRDGEDVDPLPPEVRFGQQRDIQVRWTSQVCADVHIFSVAAEPDLSEGAEEGATKLVRKHKEWREFCIE